MQNKKEDLRVRRTKKLLSDALFDLIKKKPFDKISVCDICDVAMVHRATFYSHFSDKYELLTYSMDEHLPLSKFDETIEPVDAGNAQFAKIADDIVKDICANKQIYASILKKNKEFSIVDRTQERLEEKVCSRIKRKVPNYEKLPIKPEILAGFYAGACMSVITKWLTGEISLSEDELLSNLNALLSFVPEYVLK